MLGSKCIESVTEESRKRIVQNALPLFREVGSAHNVGLQMVRKDGGVLNVLLDAYQSILPSGKPATIAAFSNPDDASQWVEACSTLRTLQQISQMGQALENAPSGRGEDDAPAVLLPMSQSSGHLAEGAIFELGQDIAANLRALSQVHEEGLDEIAEQQRELSVTARSIDKTLKELGDEMAHGQTPDRPSGDTR